MGKTAGVWKVRDLREIQKDISKMSNLLNNLILEKKLTIAALEGIEASSKILTEQVIEKMKK
jgi:hypothetical protein